MSLKILNEGFSKYFKSLNEEKCEKEDKKCEEKCTDESCDKKDVKKKNLKESEASQDISEYQKWVDYDMKKYKRISDETMNKIKKAGFSVVKDQYGDYEVIADRTIRESKKSLKEAPVYDLSPRFDSRKSFYHKAKVDTGKGDENKLYSYDTLVAEIKNGKPVVYGTYSQTTLRHIKDWLKQNGFKADSSKQIMVDYGVKNESFKNSVVKRFLEKKNRLKETKEKKIDLYINGEYAATSTRYKTAKDFIDDIKSKGTIDVASSPKNKKYTIKDTDKITARIKHEGLKRKLKESANYRGNPEIEFVWHGAWNDPELIYKGESFNYWEVEDALWEDFLEETGHKDNESNDPKVEAEFDKYVQENGTSLLDDWIASGHLDESCKGKKKLKESVSNSEYKDIIAKHFDYTFDFDFLDVVADLIDRIDFDEEDLDEEIYSAIDEGLIYDADQWKIMQYYQSPSEANFDSAIEDLTGDIFAICNKIVESKK